jgi:GT2 family glycosyltransferase
VTSVPTLDLAYFAKNRLAFTKESLRTLRANTDWSRVTNFVIYDDGSTDGTLEFLQQQATELGTELRQTSFGSGLTARSDFFRRSTADLLATIDNDAMYPPNWLDIGLGVMQRNPTLPMLCLENIWNLSGPLPHSYQPAPAGDGLAIIRRSIFLHGDYPVARGVYHGLDDWCRKHKLTIGWIKPSLPVFLLDRIPFDPWYSLSESYKAKGWQRDVGNMHIYRMDESYLWNWCDWQAPKVTLVVLSRYADIFMPLAASIEQHAIDSGIAEKILVLDAAADESEYDLPSLRARGWKILTGQSPFVFSRNVNAGIQASNPAHDILFLGDDGRFLTPSTVEQLHAAAYSDPTVGILSPQISGGLVGTVIQRATNSVPASVSGGSRGISFSSQRRHTRPTRSIAQPPTKSGLLYTNEYLCFVCVYIKRSVIDRIGLMDERFTGYGSDDVDYCQRAHAANFRLAVTPFVQIHHGHQSQPVSATFIRAMGSDQARDRSMREMGRVLNAKHAHAAQPVTIPGTYLPGGITLITPTGGRPESFALLERYIKQQTYTGAIQWLCVDDVDPATPCTMGQTVIRPEPRWSAGSKSTQRRNLLAALPFVTYDKILILEDDDHLSPSYLQEMSARLDANPIVGQPNALYYNVAYRAYYQCPNHRHASLCATGIRASLLPDLQWVCEQTTTEYIDIALWRRVAYSRGLFAGPHLCIGIKGMPGRPGIGHGHQHDLPWKLDPDLSVLRSWIGDDAALYEKYTGRVPSAPVAPSQSTVSFSRSRRPVNLQRGFLPRVHAQG